MKIYDNAFDAIYGEGSLKAKILNEKSALMDNIVDHIKNNNMTQLDAAIKIGCHQPRVSRLMSGKISDFSLVWLFDAADKIGALKGRQYRVSNYNGTECPFCEGGTLHEETREVEYTCNNHTTKIQQPGVYCNSCDESILEPKHLKETNKLIKHHRSRVGE